MSKFISAFVFVAALSTAGFSIAATMDTSLLYPYLVNPEYGFEGAPPTKDGISYPLGHNIYVSLVIDLHGKVRNVRLEDLKSVSLTPKEAHATALKNLRAAWETRQLKPNGFATPKGEKFILVSDHWLAGSSILLPNLSSWAAKYLGTSGPVLASVPHRDAMLVFSVGSKESRNEMRAIIKRNESGGLKPRTLELFEIEDGKVKPFREP